MVLKNKDLQKLEKAADRTQHYGIRKLTIGAASVLLGTTLWLGRDAIIVKAADENANSGSDAKEESSSNVSTPTIDDNTKAVVNSASDDSNNSSADISTSKETSSAANDVTSSQDSSKAVTTDKAAAQSSTTDSAVTTDQQKSSEASSQSSSSIENKQADQVQSKISQTQNNKSEVNTKAATNAGTTGDKNNANSKNSSNITNNLKTPAKDEVTTSKTNTQNSSLDNNTDITKGLNNQENNNLSKQKYSINGSNISSLSTLNSNKGTISEDEIKRMLGTSLYSFAGGDLSKNSDGRIQYTDKNGIVFTDDPAYITQIVDGSVVPDTQYIYWEGHYDGSNDHIIFATPRDLNKTGKEIYYYYVDGNKNVIKSGQLTGTTSLNDNERSKIYFYKDPDSGYTGADVTGNYGDMVVDWGAHPANTTSVGDNYGFYTYVPENLTVEFVDQDGDLIDEQGNIVVKKDGTVVNPDANGNPTLNKDAKGNPIPYQIIGRGIAHQYYDARAAEINIPGYTKFGSFENEFNYSNVNDKLKGTTVGNAFNNSFESSHDWTPIVTNVTERQYAILPDPRHQGNIYVTGGQTNGMGDIMLVHHVLDDKGNESVTAYKNTSNDGSGNWNFVSTRDVSATNNEQTVDFGKGVVETMQIATAKPAVKILVFYQKNAPVTGKVEYIDDDENDKVLKTDNLNGSIGQIISYSTQNNIKNYENQNYVLVSDNFGTTVHNFNKDASANNFEVHLKHKKTNTDESSTVTRIINYVGKDNSTSTATVPVNGSPDGTSTYTQTAHFTRTKTVDAVTNQITYGDWTSTDNNLPSVTSKDASVVGYDTVDKSVVPSINVTEGQTITPITVTYTKNPVEGNYREVTITRTLTRDIKYVVNKNKLSDTDSNYRPDEWANVSSGNTALMDKSKFENITDPQNQDPDQQEITITGTAVVNTKTGELVNYTPGTNGHFTVVKDSDGNDEQGKFIWTVNGQTLDSNTKMPGFDAPKADGYSDGEVGVMNGTKFVPNTPTNRVKDLAVLSVHTNTTGIKDADGKDISNPTVEQVLNYLNQSNTTDPTKLDLISDPANYPKVPTNIIPTSQYIFDQFQLMYGQYSDNQTPLGLYLTLAVDRNNPTGKVYFYITNTNYTRTYKSSQIPIGNYDNYADDYTDADTGTNYGNFNIIVNNYGNDFGNSVSVLENNTDFGLKRLYGLGTNDYSSSNSWGDFKPHQVTQTISYVDEDGNEIPGYPVVKVPALTGQQFDVSNVNAPNIAGYILDSSKSDTSNGNISDYVVGQTYTRTWRTLTGYTITERHKLLNSDGEMSTSVSAWDNNGNIVRFPLDNGGWTTTPTFDILPNGNNKYTGQEPTLNVDSVDYVIQNPFVKPTTNRVLVYRKNTGTPGDVVSANPTYIVYTPTAQKGSITVKVHDETDNTDLHYSPDYDLSTGEQDAGASVSYDYTTVKGDLENRGYVIDKIDGPVATIPTKITAGKDQNFIIEVKHGFRKVTSDKPVGPDNPIDPDHPTNPVNNDLTPGLTKDDLQKTVTRTINYIFTDGKHSIPSITQNVPFEGTAYIDETNGKLITVDANNNVTDWNKGSISWTPTDGNLAPIGKKDVSGYDIVSSISSDDNKSVTNKDGKTDGSVNGVSVNKDTPNITVSIVYAPQTKVVTPDKAQVEIIDEDNSNKVLTTLKNDNGSKNENISFDGQDQTLQSYYGAGYVFDKAVSAGTDNQDTTTSIATKSGDTISFNYPKFDGTPDNVQYFKIYLKHGTITQTDKDTTTAYVHYIIEGNPAEPTAPADSAKQTINWTKTDTVDAVTNQVTKEGTWTSDKNSFSDVTSPTVTGYTPSQANVSFTTPVEGQDQIVDVIYTKNPTEVTYHTKDVTKEVTRTVNYLDNENHSKSLATPVTQTAELSRKEILDNNDNVIGYGTVSTDGKSYTLNDDFTVINNGWTSVESPDETAKGYKKIPHFDDGSDASTVSAGTVNGNTPDKTVINVYYDHDTVVVPSTNPGHGLTATDLNKTVTRTINYQDNNGAAVNGSPDGKSSYVQTAHFTRTAIVDKTNNQLLGYDTNGDGKVDVLPTAGDYAWTASNNSNQFASVASKDPSEVGYNHVDIQNVSAITVGPKSDNSTVTVTYSKDAQQGSFQIHYIDEDDNNAVLHSDPESGKYGDSVTYDPSTETKTLTDQGYIEDTTYNKPDKYTTQTSITKDNNGKVYVIAFKHGIKQGTTETIVPTEKIHFRYADGTTAAPDAQGNAGNFKFTRTPTLDAVNGHVINPGTWNEESYTFNDGSKNVKVINGYVADKATYGNKTATPTDKDVEDVVIYRKISNIIPVDQNGNQIPGTTTVTYTNDPNDPTKVTPNENSPKVPNGWTISTTGQPNGVTPNTTNNTATVTPVDPTKPTKVVYTEDSEKAALHIIDINDGNKELNQIHASGQDNSGITFNNAQTTIDEWLNKGYKVNSIEQATTDPNKPINYANDYAKASATWTFDNKPGVDQQFYVYLEHDYAPINPENPYGRTDLTKQVKETVHYVDEATNKPVASDYTNTLTFTGQGMVDKVTGKMLAVKSVVNGQITYDNDLSKEIDISKASDSDFVWSNPTSFAKVTSPKITGYTLDVAKTDQNNLADSGNIKEIPSVAYNQGNVEATVYYKANPVHTQEAATLTVIDDTTGSQLADYSVTGQDGSAISFKDNQGKSANSQVTDYLSHGYDWEKSSDTDLTEASYNTFNYGKLDNDPKTNQSWTIYLVHKTKQLTPNDKYGNESLDKKITRNVQYKYDDGTTAANQVNQTVEFNGQGYVDQVTGQLVQDDGHGHVKKNADGSIASGQITWKLVNQDGKSVTNGNDTATFTEINKPTVNQNASIVRITSSGDNNYQVNNDGSVAKQELTHNDNNSNVVIVYHKGAVTEHHTAELTIYANGKQVGQATATGDKGTDISFTGAGSIVQAFEDNGFTFDHAEDVSNNKQIAGTNYNEIQFGKYSTDNNSDQKFAIYLTKASVENSGLKIVDDTENRTLANYGQSGKTGDPIKFTDGINQVQYYLSNGYKWSKADKNGTALTDLTEGNYSTYDFGKYQDNENPVWTIHLVHQIVPVNHNHPGNGYSGDQLQKTVTTDVSYVDENGKSIGIDPVHHTVTFNGSGYYDAVTNEWTDKDGKVLTDQSRGITWTNNSSTPNGDTATFAKIDAQKPAGYTYSGVTGNADQGLKINQQDGSMAAQKVTPTSGDSDLVVHFTKTPTKPVATTGSITYYDDTEGGRSLESASFNGNAGDKINYTTADRISYYEGIGYDLVSNNFADGKQIFDKDATKNVFAVHLKHATVPITPQNPGKPGEPVPKDPKNPNEPDHKYPDNYQPQTLTKDVTRTVSYVFTDGKRSLPDVKKTIEFTGQGTLDLVTGHLVTVKSDGSIDQNGSIKWNKSSDQFAEVPAIDMTGYYISSVKNTNSQATVDSKTGAVSGETVTPASNNIDIVITLKPNSVTPPAHTTQTATLTIHDATANTDLGHATVQGPDGNAISFGKTPAEQISYYLAHGYKWSNATYNGSDLKVDGISKINFGTFDKNDDSKGASQAWVINLVHQIIPVDHENPGNGYSGDQLQKTVTTDVKYVDQNGKAIAGINPVHHTVTFNGSGYYDAVTKQWTDKDGKVLTDQSKGITWTNTSSTPNGDTATFTKIDAQHPKGYTYVGITGTKDPKLVVHDDGSIDRQTVTPTSANSNLVVHFNKDNGNTPTPAPVTDNANIRVVDEDANNEVLVHSAIQGADGTNISFAGMSDTVQNYLNHNYIWDGVSQGDNTTKLAGINDYSHINFGKFDKNNKNQSWTIYLKHRTGTVDHNHPGNGYSAKDLQKTVTTDIKYVDDSNNEAEMDKMPEVKETVTFNGSGTYDKVTGNWVTVGQDGKLTPVSGPSWTYSVTGVSGVTGGNGESVKLPAIGAKTAPAGYEYRGVNGTSSGISVDQDDGSFGAQTVTRGTGDSALVVHFNKKPSTPTPTPTPSEQVADLRIIDQDDNNQVLSTYTDSGKSADDIGFNGYSADVINDYIEHGFKVVGLTNDNNSAVNATMNGTDPTKWNFGKYDNNSKVAQDFTITLKHGTTHVDHDHPGNGYKADQLEHKVTTDITYINDDTGKEMNGMAPVHEVVTIDGSGYYDNVNHNWVTVDRDGNVTGQAKGLTWTYSVNGGAAQSGDSTTLPAIPAKTIPDGFIYKGVTGMSDPKLVVDQNNGSFSEEPVDRSTANSTLVVHYGIKKTIQNANITVIDEDNGNSQLASDHINGQPNTNISFGNMDQIVANYLSNGYKWDYVDEGTTKLPATNYTGITFGKFDNDDKTTQNWTIYLRHQTGHVDHNHPGNGYTTADQLEHKVTNDITYVDDATGKEMDGMNPVHEVVTIDGSGYYDKVTHNWVTVDKNGNITGKADGITWTYSINGGTAQNGDHTTLPAIPAKQIPTSYKNYECKGVSGTSDPYLNIDQKDGSFSAEPVNRSTTNSTLVVHYGSKSQTPTPQPGEQAARITVIDETDHNSQLAYDQVGGKAGSAISFGNMGDTVNNYLNHGYVWDYVNEGNTRLGAKNYDGISFGNFDSDDKTTQNWTIYLKHGTTHVDHDHPGNGYTADQLQHKVTTDISYIDDSTGREMNGMKPVHEAVTINGSGYYDDVNHEWVNVDKNGNITGRAQGITWTYSVNDGAAQSGDSTTLPAIPAQTVPSGYTYRGVSGTGDPELSIDQSNGSFGAQKVDRSSANSNLVVHYNKKNTPTPTPGEQAANITVIDEDNKNSQLAFDQIGGNAGTQISFNGMSDQIANYLKNGYVWDYVNEGEGQDDKTQTKLGAKNYSEINFGTFDSNDQTTQNWTVYLRHGTTHVDHNNPGNGYTADQLQRTITTKVSYVDQDGNAIKGLNPVSNSVTISGQGDYDNVTKQWVTIGQDGKITGTVQGPTWTVSVNGGTAKNGDSATLPAIGAQKPNGYTYSHTDGSWDSNLEVNTNDGSVAQQTVTRSSVDSNIVVHYYKNGTPAPVVVTGKQTVHFVDNNGNEIHDSVVTTHSFTKDGTTGKWNSSSYEFKGGKNPVINGYVTKSTSYQGKTVTPDNPNADVTVVYTKIGKIIPIDDSGKPIPNASQPIYTNDPHDPTKVIPNESVPTSINGYQVDKGQKTPGYDGKTNTVTPVDPTQDTKVIYNAPKPATVTGKQTITYVDQDGKQLMPPTVSGDHVYEPGESFTYTTVTVPVISGYVANKKTAGGTKGSYDNPNTTDEVIYTKIGQIVPVDNKGNKIPGASQPVYVNDSNDPTKVKPNEGIPTVTGYDVDKNQKTPGYDNKTNTVTPVDPTKDTQVVYNPQTPQPQTVTGKQTITYVDQNGNQLLPSTISDSHTYKPGESFTYGTVTVPVISGYVANKKTVGGTKGSYDNPNTTDQVIYTKIGQIIPVDNQGQPIPGASEPVYTNDPHDPTKVVPNEGVPSVPGYEVDTGQNTPGYDGNTNTVTPVDPTKDTQVIYDRIPQPVGPNINPPTPQTPSSTPTSQPTTAQPTKPQTSTPASQPTAPIPAGPKTSTPAPTPVAHHHKHHVNHGGHSNPTPAPQPASPKPAKPTNTGYNYNNGPHAQNGNNGYSYNNMPHGENGNFSSNVMPHGENGNFSSNVGPGNENIGPNGQHLPAGCSITPNGEVVDSQGKVVGYVDKNGNIHYTALPSTGEDETNEIAAAIAGGAAVAISMIGLAGVRRKHNN